MKLLTAIVLIVALQTGGKVPDVLKFTMSSLNGQPVNLAKYQGKVLLIVNTASECGFTYQYEGLQILHARYAAKGLSLLGFPANDFGQQEPGSDAQIQQFCKANYGVEFDMFSKVTVLGPEKTPLYKYLTASAKFPGELSWNFEKFLIGRDGQILGRFKSEVEPESVELTRAIEAALAQK